MRITFQEVSLHAEKRVKCAGGCGRTLSRRKKFYQTVNPFNKMADGTVKSRYEIMPELKVESDKWLKEPETCIHCQKARPE
jgi:hypothetical protein